MRMQLGGREIDTARIGPVEVRMATVDMALLSGAALYELVRCFASTARKCRRAVLRRTRRRVHYVMEQIERQLADEAKRRADSRPAAEALLVTFKTVEDAAYLSGFLEGLENVYLSERAKIDHPPVTLEVRTVAHECSVFCGKLAAAINENEVEV